MHSDFVNSPKKALGGILAKTELWACGALALLAAHSSSVAMPIVEDELSFKDVEIVRAVCKTSDGQIALGGSNNDGDMFVLKSTKTGSVTFQRTFSLVNPSKVNSISASGDEGVGVTVAAGANGIFAVLNGNGVPQFTTLLSGNELTVHSGTDDSNFVVVGTNNMSVSECDISIARYTKTGAKLWSRTFPVHGREKAYDVVQTPDGGYALCGSIANASSSNEYDDAFLLKLDSVGTVEWYKILNSGQAEAFYGIDMTGEGYVVAGSTKDTATLQEYPITTRFDAAGNVVWHRVITTAQQGAAYDIVAMANGTYCLSANLETSRTSSSAYIIQLSSTGSVLWSKLFGGFVQGPGHSLYRANGKVLFGYSSVTNGDTSATVAMVRVHSFIHYVSNGQSIQAAIDQADSADTVLVGPGIYSESVTAVGGGTPVKAMLHLLKPVVVISEKGPDSTIIDGRGITRCVHLNLQYNHNERYPGDAVFEGFTVRNGVSLSSDTASDGGGGAGILIGDFGCEELKIKDCNWVRNCYIINNYYNGGNGGGVVMIKNMGHMENCVIAHNTVGLLARSQAFVYLGCHNNENKAYNLTVTKNLSVKNNPSSGYFSENWANIIFWNNCWVGTSSVDTLLFSFNDIADPLFIEENSALAPGYHPELASQMTPAFIGNLRLSAGSPARNSGNNMDVPSVAYDMDNNPRIQEETIDRGAFEFQP